MAAACAAWVPPCASSRVLAGPVQGMLHSLCSSLAGARSRAGLHVCASSDSSGKRPPLQAGHSTTSAPGWALCCYPVGNMLQRVQGAPCHSRQGQVAAAPVPGGPSRSSAGPCASPCASLSHRSGRHLLARPSLSYMSPASTDGACRAPARYCPWAGVLALAQEGARGAPARHMERTAVHSRRAPHLTHPGLAQAGLCAH